MVMMTIPVSCSHEQILHYQLFI